MDVYSSTASLVSTNKQDKTLYPSKHSIAQSEVSKETKRRRERAEEKGRHAGTMAVGFLNLAMVISITIIGAVYISHLQEHVSGLQHRIEAGAVYISHLQEHVSRLQHRIEALEGRSYHHSQKDQVKDRNIYKEELHGKMRVLRSSPSDQKSLEAIATEDMALFYGSPCTIEEKLKGNRIHNKAINITGRKYSRSDGQMYITTKNLSIYSTNRYNKMFHYFEKASWMDQNDDTSNFVLGKNGEIEVQKEGLYIVQSNVVFTRVKLNSEAHYSLYSSIKGKPHRIGRCDVAKGDVTDEHEQRRRYPCPIWQLTHLQRGDTVYLKIAGYSWFIVEKESLQLVLIRLNGHAQKHVPECQVI